MSHFNRKAHIREWAEEARQDQEQEQRIDRRLRKWRARTIILGVALLASIAGVVPFLYGYPLHGHWDAIGKKILLLSMCLLLVFIYTAGTTYTLWSYLRALKNINGRYAPPGSQHRARK